VLDVKFAKVEDIIEIPEDNPENEEDDDVSP
jgi:hypothetical protein